jgi:hypothetical protein
MDKGAVDDHVYVVEAGSLHRITVFVRHENVIRLLESLGYQLEWLPETLASVSVPVRTACNADTRAGLEEFIYRAAE